MDAGKVAGLMAPSDEEENDSVEDVTSGEKLPFLPRATDDPDEETYVEKFTSCRWVIGYVCCAARFSQSSIRHCIGLALVCMTLHAGTQSAEHASQVPGNLTLPKGSANSTDDVEMTAGFVWSAQYEALLLNAFVIGFVFSPIIGGHVASRIGGKRVVAVSLLGGGLSTICLPLAAKIHEVFIVILRIAAGAFLGAVDPAVQALWSKWAPKHEKAQLTTCSYTGLSLAGSVTSFIAGYLCGINGDKGWPFIFYFFGGLTLLCLPPWLLLVYDSPEQHPRVLDREKRIIEKDKVASHTKGKTLTTPWCAILSSLPFWAILVGHVTYMWVMTLMMSYLPMYLKEKMLFDIEENGLYSSLPFVGRLFSGLLAGYLSDLITRKEWFSVATTRKLFQGVGCIGCAVCMQAVGFLDHTWRGAAVVLLVLAISFQNLTSVAFRINHLDIAPRYAGVMIGMTVTAAVFFSLTGPPITAFIISRQTENLPREKSQDTTDSQADWLVVFSIMAALNVFGALFFAAFAKGSVQSWAARQMSDEDIYRG